MVKERRITWRPGLEHDGLVFEPGKVGRKRNKWNLRSGLRQQSAVIDCMGLHDRRVAIKTAGAIIRIALAIYCIALRLIGGRHLAVTRWSINPRIRDSLTAMPQ